MHIDPWSTLQFVTAAFYGLGATATLRAVRLVPPLEPLASSASVGKGEITVTVVVPARDEAARIGTTVRRLLEQRGVDVEIVVVDDRSVDATPSIVAEIARTDPRVRLLRVDELPEGWLGKPHACQRGGDVAHGEWILFLDGDVALTPETIARAVAVGRSESVEHVVLAPDCPQRTFLATVLVSSFAVGLLHEMALANTDSKRRKLGIGAFNLIRADAWRAMGGHTQLAYEVVDDMRLGLLVRRAGFRTRARVATHDVQADWGGTVPRIFGVLEKNMFAQMGYRATLSALLAVILLATWLAAITGPLFGTAEGWCAFAGLASFAIPGFVLARRERRSMLPSTLVPLGFVMLGAVLLRSMVLTLARGGVVWRGRLYPLAELRAKRVR